MSTSQQYFGNYLGIVIQNNDPEKRGRVKVFVPHVSYSLYKNWSENIADRIDKIFNNLQDESIQNVLSDLKEVLPWAEAAGPLFGGNASGRFFSPQKTAVVAHSSIWDHENGVLVQGNRPAARFTGAGSVHDGFNDGSKTSVLNPYTFEYTPSDYSNLAAGTFTVPNVGAHVWIFFENGDNSAPVYWATSYSQADFKRIYTTVKFTDESLTSLGEDALRSANISVDYPSDYENTDSDTLTPESKTFRSKHVINTNKHVIELVDTDQREILKLTHFSGSFKEWNNFTTIEFASNNDQKLVMGDQFETIRKSKNTLVTGHNRQFVEGDSFIRVGNFNYQDVKKVKDVVSEINKYKQLFDVKRIGRQAIDYRGATYDLSSIVGINNMSIYQTQVPGTGGIYSYGHTRCPNCKNIPYAPSTGKWVMGYVFNIDPVTSIPQIREINTTESSIYSSLVRLPSQRALSSSSPGIGFYNGALCDVCSSEYLTRRLRRPGFSPSTEHGSFVTEDKKIIGGDMYTKYLTERSELNKLLATMSGGDQIVEVQKNKIETIGMVMNDSPSCRVDPIGRLRVESVYVAPEGLYVSGKPSPHVEVVDTSETPGGNYIITAGNKLKFIVGSKGINIKTFGPIDMYGSILNITGESINFGCQNDINFTASEKMLIRAKKTIISSKDHEPVLIESPLHVTRNTIVQGGLYVDGEVGFQHVCSLREYGYCSNPVAPPLFLQEAGGATDLGGIQGLSVNPEDSEPAQDTLYSILSNNAPVKDYSSDKNKTDGSQQIGAKFFGVALGLVGIGIGLWNSSRSTKNTQQIIALQNTVNRLKQDLQLLSQQLAIVEEFAYNHQHLYERIPVKFFDSAVSLRGYLNDPSEHNNQATINSRNIILSARAVTPFAGSGVTAATQGLNAVGANGRIQAAATTYYTGIGAATVAAQQLIIQSANPNSNRTVVTAVFTSVVSITLPPAPGSISSYNVALSFSADIQVTPLPEGGFQYQGGYVTITYTGGRRLTQGGEVPGNLII